MIAKCLAKSLSEAQCAQIDRFGVAAVQHAITPGREYVVLGISVMPTGSPNGGGAFFEIENDWGQCRSIHSLQFEITDDRCSRHWHGRIGKRGSLCLWPEEFFSDYFHENLDDGEPEAMRAFQKAVERLANEFLDHAIEERKSI